MNIIKTSDLTSETLFGSEGIIGREHLSVNIQNLFEFSIETQENEHSLIHERVLNCTKMTVWMQVLPNLLDHDSDDDRKIQLFHLLLAMT